MKDLNKLTETELLALAAEAKKIAAEKAEEYKQSQKREQIRGALEQASPEQLKKIGKILGLEKSYQLKSDKKYVSPDGKEWSGKGRKPKWLIDYIEDGGNADDLIQSISEKAE
jgi:DNA-binding protein H-NS